MTEHELIERYVHEVGGYLPRRGRADIQRELQSLLEDAVEERTHGADPTAQLVSKVLREFGKPQEMAAQYSSRQHLIGRNLYPRFRLVTSVVFAVITIINILLVIFLLWNNNSADFLPLIWARFTDTIQALFFSLGIITAVFVGIEHYFGDEIAAQEDSAEWDPLELPPVNDPDRIKRFEQFTEIIFGSVGVAALIWATTTDSVFGWLFVDEFRPMIGWFVASACLDILLNIFVLWQGRWQPLTRWLEIAVELFSLYVLYQVAASPAILTIEGLDSVVKLGLNGVMLIVTVVIVVKAVQQLWRWQFGSQFDWRTHFIPKSAV